MQETSQGGSGHGNSLAEGPGFESCFQHFLAK